MATLRGALAGLVATLFACGVFADDDVPLVKGAGDLDQLEVRGAAAFDEAEIKAALAADIDVVVATRADAPRAALEKVLGEKTLDGYLAAGYADAKADVRFDPAAEKLVLEIVEGAPYVAGAVEVAGAKTIDAARLIERLTHSNAAAAQASKTAKAKSAKKPRWPVGDAPALDPESLGQLCKEIEDWLYDQGLLEPNFAVEHTPDRERKIITLKIAIVDEGAPAMLDLITIMGAEKNSEQDILQFLGIEKGMRWTKVAWAGAEQKLKESGRFTKVKVRSPKPKPGRAPWLWIDLAEYEKAPLLTQPLSREEQALVKLSQWLHEFPEGQDELVMTWSDDLDSHEVVISPQLGALYEFTRTAKREEAMQPAPFEFAYVTSDERIGLYSLPRGRKLVAIPTPSPVIANLALKLHDGPPKLSGQGEFMFGMGMATSGTRSRRRQCEFKFNDTAVSLLSLAHEYDSKLTWEGDVLTVEYKDQRLKLSGKTGRLVEIAGQEGTGRISVAQGEFKRRLAAIDAATRELPNDADENPARPLSSVLEFLADEVLELKDYEVLQAFEPQIRLLRKLVSLGLFKPLDRLGVAACRPEPEGDSFGIPPESWHFSLSDVDFSGDWLHDPNFQTMLRGAAANLGLHIGNHMLPALGWPMAVYREAIYAKAEKTAPEACAIDLTKLCAAPESGPLCCLSAAAAAKVLPLGVPASLLANLGKTKLSLADFQDDYRELLDGDSLLGEYLLCLVEVLRGLDEDEVSTLVALLRSCDCLDQRSLTLLAAGAAELREHRDRPIDEALAAALDQSWRNGLRQRIKTMLDELATEPPPPSEGPKLADQGTYGAYQAAPDSPVIEGAGAGPAYTPDNRYAPGATAPDYSPAEETSYSPAPRYGSVELPPKSSAAAAAPLVWGGSPLALEGYSAVTLVKQREWRLGDARYSAIHHDRLYLFADEGERETFLINPDRYSVGNNGFDIVQQLDHQHKTPGQREFGLFYKGRILLFESEESRTRFEQNWSHYESALLVPALEAMHEANEKPAAGPIAGSTKKPAPVVSAAAGKRSAVQIGRRRLFGRRWR